MPDPDLEIRQGGGSPKEDFSALRASVWSKIKRGEAPPLDPPLICKYQQVIFRPIKRLKLIGSWFNIIVDRSTKCYSVLSRENNGTLSSLNMSPLQYSKLFALRQWRIDLMTFQTNN